MSMNLDELRARIRCKADEELAGKFTARQLATLRWAVLDIALANGLDILLSRAPQAWAEIEGQLAQVDELFGAEIVELAAIYQAWLQAGMTAKTAGQRLLASFVREGGADDQE